MAKSKFQPLDATIDNAELTLLADRAGEVLQSVRSSMLAPDSKKTPPVFNSAQLAELSGVAQSKIQYLSNKGNLPGGSVGTTRKEWTLKETQQWVRHLRPETIRDPSVSAGVVITVANFKGGVSKTTTAAALAQGLSMRGHKCLVIDLDAQGSLTTLFGVLPDTEVEEDQTVLPLFAGLTDSIMPSIRPTYWDGIDLVAGAQLLFNAEFLLPSRQMKEANFKFWEVLDRGLDAAREVYDVIIIDTAPSLSYITVNALVAAQGIVMPLPPSALDFASSAQFWNLFTEVCGGLYNQPDSVPKKYAFVNVLLSRVDQSDVLSSAVREWIVKAYGRHVLPIEIPKTSIAATASAEFGTVYDMTRGSAQARTLKRAKDAYDRFVEHVAFQLGGIWASDSKLMSDLKGRK